MATVLRGKKGPAHDASCLAERIRFRVAGMSTRGGFAAETFGKVSRPCGPRDGAKGAPLRALRPPGTPRARGTPVRPFPCALRPCDLFLRPAHRAFEPGSRALGAPTPAPGEETRGLGPGEPGERPRAREQKRSPASVLDAVPGPDEDGGYGHGMPEPPSADHDMPSARRMKAPANVTTEPRGWRTGGNRPVSRVPGTPPATRRSPGGRRERTSVRPCTPCFAATAAAAAAVGARTNTKAISLRSTRSGRRSSMFMAFGSVAQQSPVRLGPVDAPGRKPRDRGRPSRSRPPRRHRGPPTSNTASPRSSGRRQWRPGARPARAARDLMPAARADGERAYERRCDNREVASPRNDGLELPMEPGDAGMMAATTATA